jgi:hypothetical protein
MPGSCPAFLICREESTSADGLAGVTGKLVAGGVAATSAASAVGAATASAVGNTLPEGGPACPACATISTVAATECTGVQEADGGASASATAGAGAVGAATGGAAVSREAK